LVYIEQPLGYSLIWNWLSTYLFGSIHKWLPVERIGALWRQQQLLEARRLLRIGGPFTSSSVRAESKSTRQVPIWLERLALSFIRVLCMSESPIVSNVLVPAWLLNLCYIFPSDIS